MHTEDDVRAALRVLADDAPDPSAILSALLPATHPGLGTRRARHDGRLSRIVAPVAAAAAVLAVVVTSIAIGTGGHRGGGAAPAASVHGSGLPPYYVEIMQPPGQSGLVATVRDTRTAVSLATVQPPRGYWFIDAGPGADYDSFLLEANQYNGPPGLYLLRFNPRDRGTSLTRLPIAVTLYTHGLATSPSGTEVAVASGTNTGKVPSKLQIYTLSGRLIRQWQAPGTICLSGGLSCLSWAAGYLAFSWNNNATNIAAEGIRLIPATAASGSLLGASRLVLPFKTVNAASFVLSGDGTTIPADVQLRPRPGVIYNVFEEFSAATGKLTGRYWPSRQDFVGAVYWSNWTGSKLIVTAPFPRTSRSPRWSLGILTGGRFTPLPIPAGNSFAIAF
jgi:hypothetical protein